MINVFMYEHYPQEFNSLIMQAFNSIDDESCEVKISVNIPRHYGLSEYNTFSLAIWAHLMKT